MPRKTGSFSNTVVGDEVVKAFTPFNLPPRNPVLKIEGELDAKLKEAEAAIGKLVLAGQMVPSPEWYLYGFVRKEAVISSQIEGTQATLRDVVKYEADGSVDNPDDVEEVCNYIAALKYARQEIARPKGLPVCIRLFCEMHKILLKGVRGSDKEPGEIRRSQNWIGGTRPGNASFVPPPPGDVGKTLSSLEKWINKDEKIPPLVRAGLAHAQFETIHPFLDGNGRIGRLLISLLLEFWKVLPAPMLYLSLAFKRHRSQYYNSLSRIRDEGDWEGWVSFFLDSVLEAAQDGVNSSTDLFNTVNRDRALIINHPDSTLNAIRLYEMLPGHPVITLPRAVEMTGRSKPTIIKAIDALVKAGILSEISGKKRDRIYTYSNYLEILGKE